MRFILAFFIHLITVLLDVWMVVEPAQRGLFKSDPPLPPPSVRNTSLIWLIWSVLIVFSKFESHLDVDAFQWVGSGFNKESFGKMRLVRVLLAIVATTLRIVASSLDDIQVFRYCTARQPAQINHIVIT